MCSKCCPSASKHALRWTRQIWSIAWSTTLFWMPNQYHISVTCRFQSDKLILNFQFFKEYQTGRWCEHVKFSLGDPTTHCSAMWHVDTAVDFSQTTSRRIAGLIESSHHLCCHSNPSRCQYSIGKWRVHDAEQQDGVHKSNKCQKN